MSAFDPNAAGQTDIAEEEPLEHRSKGSAERNLESFLEYRVTSAPSRHG